MTRVKICGNTNLNDVSKAIEFGADFIGFIFAPSKRRISQTDAATIIKEHETFDGFVGVFVNESLEQVKVTARLLGLRWIQLHGNEPEEYCASLSAAGFSVIKAFQVKQSSDLNAITQCSAPYILFDSFHETLRGGTGTAFDWDLIEGQPAVAAKAFLAGGLTPQNVSNAINQVKPFAVDVVTGVEKSPGIKDHQKLHQFIRNAKSPSGQLT